MKEFRNLIGEDILRSFIQEASAFEFGIPPEHGGVRNALDNAKRLLSEFGLDGKIVAGGDVPVLRVFGDPQSVLKWAAQVGPDTYAEDYSVEDLEKEHAVGLKREMGERYVLDEVLMVRTQKTKDGKSYEWLVQKVLHNDTKTVASGTESSRAKAAAAGKKAKKGLKEAVAADQIGKILKKYRTDFAKFKKGKSSLGDPGMENFYNALFDYFVSSGEMPYGTAKARSGDPLEWIEDRLMDEGIRGKDILIIDEAVDKATVSELVLYITNDSQLYRQRIQPIIKNLSKKVGNATYDGLKAIKAFGYAVTDGLKKYEKEHATKGWAKSVDKKTREAIAEELLDYYSEQIGEEKKNVGIEINENLAYLQSKDGKKTFVIAPRDTRGMRGKQDKFSMFIVDAKTGKKIEDLGSHVSLKGAIKFALKRGFVKEKEKVDARGLRSWGAVGEARMKKKFDNPLQLDPSRSGTTGKKPVFGKYDIVSFSDPKTGKKTKGKVDSYDKTSKTYVIVVGTKKVKGVSARSVKEEMNEAAPPKASKGMELKSVKREYEKLMKKWGNTPITKIPFKDFSKIRELGDKLMGTPKDAGAGMKVGDLLKHMKEAFTKGASS